MQISSKSKFPAIISAITVLLFIVDEEGYVEALNDENDLVFTAAEQDALDQLKPEVMDILPEEYMKSDFYLIRFLRSNNLDVISAQNMINQSVIWRKENNISEILNEDWTDFQQQFPISIEGHDKYNRPLVAFDISKWHMRTAVNAYQGEKLERYLKFILEKIVHEIVRTREEIDGNVTRAFIMIDSGGLGYWQHLCSSCIAIMTRWVSSIEKYYPMFLDQIIVINTSSLGPYALGLVWPFMSYETRRVLQTFTARRSDQWMAYLDENVDASQRAPIFGGTKAEYNNNIIYSNVLVYHLNPMVLNPVYLYPPQHTIAFQPVHQLLYVP